MPHPCQGGFLLFYKKNPVADAREDQENILISRGGKSRKKGGGHTARTGLAGRVYGLTLQTVSLKKAEPA